MKEDNTEALELKAEIKRLEAKITHRDEIIERKKVREQELMDGFNEFEEVIGQKDKDIASLQSGIYELEAL